MDDPEKKRDVDERQRLVQMLLHRNENQNPKIREFFRDYFAERGDFGDEGSRGGCGVFDGGAGVLVASERGES